MSAPTLLRGIDASEWQGEIDWHAVPDWVTFVPIRLAEWRRDRGGPRIDSQAAANVKGARDTGRTVGGYMRMDPPNRSPEDEALLFHALLAHFDLDRPGCLIPAFDIEPTDNPEADKTVNWPRWVRDFVEAYQDGAGDPRLRWYSSGSHYSDRYGGVVDLPLSVTMWVGHWSGQYSVPKNPTGDRAMAEAWAGATPYVFSGRTTMHQYFKAEVPGIPSATVDLNCLMSGVALETVQL